VSRDWTEKKRRVPLELTEAELKELDELVEVRKTRTRMRLVRRALRFYKVLSDHKEQGYLIQAVKQGSLLQFPDLDVPYPKEVPLKRRP
jgi:metal-responsive CopG/Arc/MetJ family transcriptional regulator